MLVFRVMYDAFGFLPEAINLLQIGLVALCAVLIVDYVGTLSNSRVTGRIVAVLWILSAGTANALSWQATNHEKLALVFALLTALVVGTVRSRSTRAAYLVGGLATLLAAFALNSKEIAFFLAVVLPIQGFFFAGARAVLPTLYVAAFAGTYLFRLKPDFAPYAFGETSVSWLFPYSAGLLGFVRSDFGPLRLSDGGIRVAAALAAITVIVVGCLVYASLVLKDRTTLRFRAAATLAAWWGSCLVIIVNPGNSLYCLLVPSVGFLGTIVVVSEDLAGRWGGVRPRWTVRAGLLALFAGTFVWMLLPGQALERHLSACRNVAAAHAAMRREVPETSHGPFVFVLDGGNERMRWLFFDSSERCVMNFALRRPGDLPHSIARGERSDGDEGTYYFRFDSAFELRSIER
jgi:hypothetical protein